MLVCSGVLNADVMLRKRTDIMLCVFTFSRAHCLACSGVLNSGDVMFLSEFIGCNNIVVCHHIVE